MQVIIYFFIFVYLQLYIHIYFIYIYIFVCACTLIDYARQNKTHYNTHTYLCMQRGSVKIFTYFQRIKVCMHANVKKIKKNKMDIIIKSIR